MTAISAIAAYGGIRTNSARPARMAVSTDMLAHGQEAIVKARAKAIRILDDVERDTTINTDRKAIYTQHWTMVRDDCTDALNVLAVEATHRELKRKGIR